MTALTAQTNKPLTASSLNVSGLNYETELTALFLGDFAHSRLRPDDLRFLTLLGGYINGFARSCSAHLPANRVPIMESRCTQETVRRNGFGTQIGPATCSRYESFPTGLYADPQLLSLSKRLEGRQSMGAISTLFNPNGDTMGFSRQAVDSALSLGDDMNVLFRKNACGGAAIKRLQANLLRFGEGQAALRLANGATLASTRSGSGGGAAFRDSNYGRLIDDLVAENARGWMMNRYVSGSITGASVQRRDSQGRPASVSAGYRYNGFNGSASGSVTLTFEDGVPQCLYFFDAPQTCRLPNPRIVTAYEKGGYR